MNKKIKKPRIALVHDFLLKLGGAERVLKNLSDLYPDAPIYTLLYNEESVGRVFPKEKVRTSFLQKYPKFLRNRYKYLVSLLPHAVERMDFSDFDIVISSSNAYTHGILTHSYTKHITYYHSPMRYAWDYTHEYLNEQSGGRFKKAIARKMINKIRIWDKVASDRPDVLIANSKTVQKRISKYYRRDSEVVYPPVDISRFKSQKKHEDYFLIVSTLTPYKKIDLAVRLFNKIKKPLVVIGDGPHKNYLESIADDNIKFLGFQSDKAVGKYMQEARAFIFPGEEDFGITPVEAMACGKPILAYGKGGLTETVIPGKTGEFFYEQTIESMEDGLGRLFINEDSYKASQIRKHAENFSVERFEKEIKTIVKEA